MASPILTHFPRFLSTNHDQSFGKYPRLVGDNRQHFHPSGSPPVTAINPVVDLSARGHRTVLSPVLLWAARG
ncbi:hypothetical protein RRG08_049228 [Elysia crispata]|uniref:Uncharacterized protein n=1 Tax=Elysia crispata TaxID=231223 RepID=A0AAE0YTT9_9GAST|nr:hypothetical protein RRG08_049228 [Elysia crispata]